MPPLAPPAPALPHARSSRRCSRPRRGRAPLACHASQRWREASRGRVREYTQSAQGRLEAAALAEGAAAQSRSAGLVDAARDFLLPPGFPASVSGDYGRYAALTFPCHVSGALAGALATAALLHGVGLGAAAAAAAAPGAPAALSAAAKWVSKDGLGAAGRLVVAGRVARALDAEPRQWRLAAEAAALAGGALDVATALAPPSAFLPLAAAGTALRACAKAVAAPAHQVILVHFARTGNLGAVAAKEEVQEVLAQLLGLAASVALLQQPALRDSQEALAAVWGGVSLLHVALRAAALGGLRFTTLSPRRAAAAAAAHVAGEPAAAWAGFGALNARDAAAPLPWGGQRLRVCLGASLADAARACPAATSAPDGLAALATALAAERFLLTWHPGAAHVILREHATPRDALRATWLAARLAAAAPVAAPDADALLAQLRDAFPDFQQRFPDFEAALVREGWDIAPLLPPLATTPRLLDDVEVGGDDGASDVAAARGAAQAARL